MHKYGFTYPSTSGSGNGPAVTYTASIKNTAHNFILIPILKVKDILSNFSYKLIRVISFQVISLI